MTSVFIWISGHTLILEMFGKKYRPYVAFIELATFPGQLVCVGIMYFTRHWKYIQIWSGIISCLALPCLLLIPGSATNAEELKMLRTVMFTKGFHFQTLSAGYL